MDVAYDSVQKESFPDDQEQQGDSTTAAVGPPPGTFNNDVQEAYKAISSSPWAARLGGLWGNVKKQGEQYYEGAQKQYSTASEQATQGLTSIIGRTRGLSIQQPADGESAASPAAPQKQKEALETHPARPDSLPADILKEAGGLLSRFRSEAQKRLKDIEKAEDAADEALLKFGSNIRNYLREAVVVAPPDTSEGADNSKVLFESKDAEGRRVIHTTRFDAQLHVIHSSLDSFLKDPVSPQWVPWGETFDIKAHTETISKDLEKYEDLRRAMEKLVPEKVEYSEFWTRYYFLRHVIESEEQRRKEMLKASANTPDEDVAWDEDSDDDDNDNESSTPNKTQPLSASKETLRTDEKDNTLLKPSEPRKSGDQHSQADSDASYDVVSGATSRAHGSPKETKTEVVAEESDEDDWE
ncbi:BSD-domain-containing protein [Pseudovirgaria hyperparasitica]|uniref:BSD-domain-containing protein n=1 Tax=Pseudovirgaria hyperparasitica TaxID=470096 RepID=A0A6A6WCC5_9PEZI|nr:BSD-domain-containing protein [Pseudovirgaria hyperparasitica]KAF2760363.1 BSD-domain-containing protein [Pseudovirgaria hyperparasitica]